MSIAFTKEPDADLLDELPDRPISANRNLVTPEGLARIEAEVERLQHELTKFQGKAHMDQTSEERAAAARLARDLRYWTARRSTAELVRRMTGVDQVHFGSAVTIERDHGRRQIFRIVGEDEADPGKGLISHVSPLARALIGKRVGDAAQVAASEVEIRAIE